MCQKALIIFVLEVGPWSRKYFDVMLKREEYEIGLIYFWVIGKEKGQAREGVL